ncbi:MAG TPA: tetratricopeptide repeat protein, partial [Chthoniobacterales bacterium]|nr:tetratricopeptide repeat protein [Chthoniobacterales bacterium]
IAEKPAPAARPASPSDAGTAAPAELPAAPQAEPASTPAIADNPPKPPKAQPKLQTPLEPEQQVVTTDQTRPEIDDTVDPVARNLIARGWALYNMPYTLVKWQEARRDFEKALELDSRSSEARIGLASILSTKLADQWSPVLQEDPKRAEQLLAAVLDKDDVSKRHKAEAHFTLGVLRQMQIRLSEAQSEFEVAMSLDPNNSRTFLHLGQTLLFLGRPEAAIPPLEQAIRLGPDGPRVAITHWALGTCQLLLGRVDQAIDLLQTARAADTRLWVPYFYLAGAYGLQGDLDRARSALAESIRRKPAVKSLDRMRVENAWLGNPQYWALQEKTLNLGLRRAGLPDH